MPNIWKLDETHSSTDPASQEAWLAPTSVSESMEEMRGYALNTSSGVTLNFSGDGSSLNTGSKSIAVTKTGMGGGVNGEGGNGWHLVGNPYPSPIDWNAIAAGLPAGVSHTVAFYYPTNQWAGGFGFYHPIAGPSGAYPHNRYIPSSQSFYLNTTSNATVTLNNSYRTVSSAAMGTSFYKKTEKTPNTNPIVRLSGIYNGPNSGYKDETVVFFNEIATTTFNYQTDAQKFMNTDPTIPNIYTIKDNRNLAINGLPEITDNLIVPIGFDVQLEGDYSINAKEIGNIDPATTNVYLEDLAKNVSQDLIVNPNYNFKVNPVDKGGRFFLRFKLALATSVETKDTKTDLLYAYSSGKSLFVNYNSSRGETCKFNVTNLQGQIVFEAEQISTGQHIYNLNQAPGCYVVKMVSSNNVSVQKVYIY
jgi:fibronectin-binding autotransporter adhesin